MREMTILTKLSTVLVSCDQFWPVLDGRNWSKQVLPSFFHFGRKKQVLDGKNPTLPLGHDGLSHVSRSWYPSVWRLVLCIISQWTIRTMLPIIKKTNMLLACNTLVIILVCPFKMMFHTKPWLDCEQLMNIFKENYQIVYGKPSL